MISLSSESQTLGKIKENKNIQSLLLEMCHPDLNSLNKYFQDLNENKRNCQFLNKNPRNHHPKNSSQTITPIKSVRFCTRIFHLFFICSYYTRKRTKVPAKNAFLSNLCVLQNQIRIKQGFVSFVCMFILIQNKAKICQNKQACRRRQSWISFGRINFWTQLMYGHILPLTNISQRNPCFTIQAHTGSATINDYIFTNKHLFPFHFN